MKAQLIREEFLKTVLIANRFVPLRPGIPVLANLLLRGTKGKLEVTATNLEASVKLILPAKNEENWEITVPAKIINEFASSAVDKEISLEVDKESLTLVSGDLRGQVSGISANEFPKLPETSGTPIDFELKELQNAVNNVAFAASNDEAKPILTGIFINQEGSGTIIVATDGYRLAKKTLSQKYDFNQVVIPAKTLVESLRIAAEMEETNVGLQVSKEENQTLLKGDNFLIASRILDGTYPAFQQIIPSNFVTEFSVAKEKLLTAIKGTAVFARDLGNVVRLAINPEGLEITANTAQIGEGSAKINLPGVKGDSLKVAFNSRYLLEGLGSIKAEEVELKFSGALSPAQISGKGEKDFLYIVMPVKSQN